MLLGFGPAWSNSPEPCWKPRVAGGEAERDGQQEIRGRYQKHQVEESSLFTAGFATDAEAISKSRSS